VVTDAESARELAALTAPLDPSLSEAFAATELAPRVAIICLLHRWTADAVAGDAAAAQTCAVLWQQLMRTAAEDAALAAKRYCPGGMVHRKKVRVWQALCALCPSVSADEAPIALRAVISALSCPDAADVKEYMEIVAAQLASRAPEVLSNLLLPRLRDVSKQKADAVPSMAIVAVHAVLRKEEAAGAGAVKAETEDVEKAAMLPANTSSKAGKAAAGRECPAALAEEVALVLLPWCMTYNHACRAVSQAVLWRLLELRPAVMARSPALAAALAFFAQNQETAKLREAVGQGAMLESFDLEAATSPKGIFCQAS
jgi:hypothetical protein